MTTDTRHQEKEQAPCFLAQTTSFSSPPEKSILSGQWPQRQISLIFSTCPASECYHISLGLLATVSSGLELTWDLSGNGSEHKLSRLLHRE